MKSKCIKIAQIASTAETQSRTTINSETVNNYAERMLEGDKFPPVILFHDKSLTTDQCLFVGDGFHRLAACVKNQFVDIQAEVKEGTQLDALRYSIGANRANGLARSNADKRRATWLAVQFFGDNSNRAIADMVGVSDPFVGKVREEFDAESESKRGANDSQSAAPAAPKKRKGRDGKVRIVRGNRKRKGPVARVTLPPYDSKMLAGLKSLWSMSSDMDKSHFRAFLATHKKSAKS